MTKTLSAGEKDLEFIKNDEKVDFIFRIVPGSADNLGVEKHRQVCTILT